MALSDSSENCLIVPYATCLEMAVMSSQSVAMNR